MDKIGGEQIDRSVVAKIKGMLSRGDEPEDIAVWFGVNIRAVRAVAAGMVDPLIEPAPRSALPPAGPYAHGQGVYAAMQEVREAEHRLYIAGRALRRRNRH